MWRYLHICYNLLLLSLWISFPICFLIFLLLGGYHQSSVKVNSNTSHASAAVDTSMIFNTFLTGQA